MPHKRAKRSVRESESAKKGQNLPPTPSSTKDDTPGSAKRILNSFQSQSAFRSQGRTNSEDTGERRKQPKLTSGGVVGPSSSARTGITNRGEDVKSSSKGKGKGKEEVPGIMPNESLGDYNRRVESLLRPGVSRAIKDASRAGKINSKSKSKSADVDPSTSTSHDKSSKSGSKGKAKHDISDPPKLLPTQPNGIKRLNDIVTAPPSLLHLKGLKSSGNDGGSVWTARESGKEVLNLGQRRLLEVERERVVGLYRDMKARRLAESQAVGKGKGKGRGEKGKGENVEKGDKAMGKGKGIGGDAELNERREVGGKRKRGTKDEGMEDE